MVTITESARVYLKELLDKQADALGVRVFINNPVHHGLRPALPIAGKVTCRQAMSSMTLNTSMRG